MLDLHTGLDPVDICGIATGNMCIYAPGMDAVTRCHSHSCGPNGWEMAIKIWSWHKV